MFSVCRPCDDHDENDDEDDSGGGDDDDDNHIITTVTAEYNCGKLICYYYGQIRIHHGAHWPSIPSLSALSYTINITLVANIKTLVANSKTLVTNSKTLVANNSKSLFANSKH